jgi:hypothetical protein
MKCPICNGDYFDKNQRICEYCGSDLINETQKPTETILEPKTKLDSFLDDLGLKNLYKKIKKSLRDL